MLRPRGERVGAIVGGVVALPCTWLWGLTIGVGAAAAVVSGLALIVHGIALAMVWRAA